MYISKKAREMQESPIRKLAGFANRAKEEGKYVYHLNIGQPDIETPEVFYKEITDYKEKVLAYGQSDGLKELKNVMVDYYGRYNINLNEKDIIVCTGGSEAISFAFNAVADEGDEIIIPEPFYTNYNGYATMAGLKIKPVTTLAEEGFHLPKLEEIEKQISDKTKAILVCSPNNPTGTVFTEEEIRGLAKLALKHNLFLIGDEVYKEFTYEGGKHFSLLELGKEMHDSVIVIDSISKRYSACGARIGCFISRNEELISYVMRFAQARLCPPTLEQLGAIAAYKMDMEYFDLVKEEYAKRRDVLVDILQQNPDIVLQKPKGAFYLMAKLPIDDADKFARWLLEEYSHENETVMVAPGAGFYSTKGKGLNEIRMAYVLNCEKLKRAGEILLKALEAYNSL